MNCWYVYGQECDRKGVCEGCEVYQEWHRKVFESIELKPCPKCKGEAVRCHFGEEHWIACKVCHHDTVSYANIEDAIKDWNRWKEE